MPIRTKPHRRRFEDEFEANTRIIAPILKRPSQISLILAGVTLGFVVYLVVVGGLPASNRDVSMVLIGALVVEGVFCLARFVEMRRNRMLRKQLQDRHITKSRERLLTIEIDGHEIRSETETSHAVSSLDDYYHFRLKNGAVCLFNPGTRALVVVRTEDFESEEDWQALLQTLSTVPRYPV